MNEAEAIDIAKPKPALAISKKVIKPHKAGLNSTLTNSLTLNESGNKLHLSSSKTNALVNVELMTNRWRGTGGTNKTDSRRS